MLLFDFLLSEKQGVLPEKTRLGGLPTWALEGNLKNRILGKCDSRKLKNLFRASSAGRLARETIQGQSQPTGGNPQVGVGGMTLPCADKRGVAGLF